MIFGLLNAVGLFIIRNYSFNSYADGLRLTIAANLDVNSLCAYTNIYPPRNLVIFYNIHSESIHSFSPARKGIYYEFKRKFEDTNYFLTVQTRDTKCFNIFIFDNVSHMY